MIEGKLDSRTLALMNAALDQVCAQISDGEDHAVRKRIAREIVRCATNKKATLPELIEAGQRGLIVTGPAAKQRRRIA